VHEAALAAWESFYVIVGSSGAALIGLQFVVIALVSEIGPRPNTETLDAFATPTIVHFGGALLISGVMSAPWPSLLSAGIALAACGLLGMTYTTIVLLRARRQSGYKPVFEDWLWHTILPFASYISLTVAAVVLRLSPHPLLFVVAASAMSLLFIGIHNAWDTVEYIVTERRGGGPSEEHAATPPGPEAT
jgi:hypothetical protein